MSDNRYAEEPGWLDLEATAHPMTNSDRLQEIRERADKATKGPWTVEWDGDNAFEHYEEVRWPWRIQGVCNIVDENEQNPVADGEFIAASREDIPWLLQHITEQQREIEVLREEIDGMVKTADRWIAAAVKAGVGPTVATAAARKGYRKQERPM